MQEKYGRLKYPPLIKSDYMNNIYLYCSDFVCENNNGKISLIKNRHGECGNISEEDLTMMILLA